MLYEIYIFNSHSDFPDSFFPGQVTAPKNIPKNSDKIKDHVSTVQTAYIPNTNCKIIDVTKNATAAIEVYLPSNASRVLPLFLPKNVSAPPAIDPDKPADLPDCINTMITMANAMIK